MFLNPEIAPVSNIWIRRWRAYSGAGDGFYAPVGHSHRVNEQLGRALTINVEIVLQQAKNLPFRSLSLSDHRAD